MSVVCSACGHTHQGARLGYICIGCPCPELPAAPVPDVPEENEVRDELEGHARDEELANVLALLRSEECTALLCRADCLTYVQKLIERLERGEHRR